AASAQKPVLKTASASTQTPVLKTASASTQTPVLRHASASTAPATAKVAHEVQPAAPVSAPITVAKSPLSAPKPAAAPNFMTVSKSDTRQLMAMNTTPELPVKAAADPAAQTKPADAKPNDFVFVEPSYKQKDEAAKPDPTARAADAASTMAQTTTAAMMPPPSASMHPQEATQAPSTAQPSGAQPAVNLAAQQQQQMKQSLSASKQPHYSGEPISVNLKDVDLKDFFRLIHEISGLNVVLDPNVHGTLTIVLDDVPWDQALDIVLKNNQLDRQLEGNVLRIATID